MSDMLVGCVWSCVVRGGLVVMGGQGDGLKVLADVQVFNGKTQTWHFGPSLPSSSTLLLSCNFLNLFLTKVS